LRQRHDGIPDDLPLVYEFDLQRSSGDALLELYMSLKSAVQKWQDGANITLCESSLLPCVNSDKLVLGMIAAHRTGM
jgi:hypothetical protein